MLWDTHIHTSFSSDSTAAPNDMIQAAITDQLAGICFTDHMDLDYPDSPDRFLLDTDSYYTSMKSLQKSYQNQLPVLIGIELGLQPHLAAKLSHLLRQYPFDFVIGSSHVVHGFDPYYPAYYEGKTENEAYLEYFESILENVNAFTDFDVYGHIDYVVRYGPNKNAAYSYQKYADIIDCILKRLIELGKGIEINTAGFKYGLGHPNPTEDILKRYLELGGEILTIGADGHKPEHIAYDFAKVPAILKEAGFSYYTVFKNRKPEFIAIP